MKLEILSPEKYLFNGEAEKITLPGTGGVFSVMDNHVPLISSLKSGTIRVLLSDGKENEMNITSGMIEVRGNEVVVCVNEIFV